MERSENAGMNNSRIRAAQAFIIVWVLLLLLFVAVVSNHEPSLITDGAVQTSAVESTMDEAVLLQEVTASGCIIQSYDAMGSGCIYEIREDEVILVSAAHLLRNDAAQSEVNTEETGTVTLPTGESAPFTVLFISETDDYGFAAVQTSDLSEETINGMKAVDDTGEAYDVLQKNDCFFMPNFWTSAEETDETLKEDTEKIDREARISQITMKKGYVVDKNRYVDEYGTEMLYADGNAVEGMSGTGLYDAQGRWLGILSGATEQQELAAVPATKIVLPVHGF